MNKIKNIDINKLINLSVDIWRLEEKISKIDYLKEQDIEKISVSLDRLKKFIKDLDIELK
jgi:predicted ATP-grasp superfamily ATP-dependent carboligase